MIYLRVLNSQRLKVEFKVGAFEFFFFFKWNDEFKIKTERTGRFKEKGYIALCLKEGPPIQPICLRRTFRTS